MKQNNLHRTISRPPGIFRSIKRSSDPGEVMFFAESEADYQSFLISQMRLNDELSAELTILQRRKLQALLKPNFLSRDYLALTTQKTP